MKVKIITVITVITYIILTLGGCKMNKTYSSKEEAREYLLSAMKEKYNMTFVIVGDEDYTKYGVHGYSYGCQIAPENDSEEVAYAMVRQNGKLSDSWGVYYFKDEVESSVNEIIKSNENIKVKELSLEAPITELCWTKEDKLEDYLNNSGAYIKIRLECEDGKSSQEYAKIIHKFLTPIYMLEVDSDVLIRAGNRYIFSEKIYVSGENKTTPFTVEEIEEWIETYGKYSIPEKFL